jgi:6-pyruvoyltetrahydropterin/6-carboxytetrahydropterin synthase
MEIVKKFNFEMAHIVRHAWSTRCSHSIHGHSYVAELVFERDDSDHLMDDGQMVVDFGLIKKYIFPFIDSFDHTTLLWKQDDPWVINFFTANFDRVVLCSASSSCEMMAAIFLCAVNLILRQLKCSDNYWKGVICKKVIIHETKSGRAECDLHSSWLHQLDLTTWVKTLVFSEAIQEEWPEYFQEIWDAIKKIPDAKIY